MSVTTIAFFNGLGRIGKTTLVHNLSWMLAGLGKRVLAVDLDPQAGLTALFLDREELAARSNQERSYNTLFRSLRPVLDREGNLKPPTLELIEPGLALLPGDLALATVEEDFARAWCLGSLEDEHAIGITASLREIFQSAAREHEAEFVLLDMGPNLGAINRAALLAADHLIVPLTLEQGSHTALQCLGPKLRNWCEVWRENVCVCPYVFNASGAMNPLGYIVLERSVRLDKPQYDYAHWHQQVPNAFHIDLLDQPQGFTGGASEDSRCLGLVRHYRTLVDMAEESRKPLFNLRMADGAVGAHFKAAQLAGTEFKTLAFRLLNEIERVDHSLGARA